MGLDSHGGWKRGTGGSSEKGSGGRKQSAEYGIDHFAECELSYFRGIGAAVLQNEDFEYLPGAGTVKAAGG